MPGAPDQEFMIAGMDLILRGVGREPSRSAAIPRISVVMPVFNRERIVEDALDSLRRQSWRHFEAIVVDDASTDATAAILATWAAREPWMRVVTNRVRSGAAAARNRGLAAAAGEVITYLDSDNVFYLHALEVIAETFRASPEVWSIYTAHLWTAADGTMLVRCPRITLPGLMAMTETFDLNAFAHRRALYEALGGFDERLTRLIDWDLAVRYGKAVMARRVPVPTGLYRHGDWPRISNEVPFGLNRHLIATRHGKTVASALRVLCIVAACPPAALRGLAAECRFMRAHGVRIELWVETPPLDLDAADPFIVHTGTLAAAIDALRPDLLHMHCADGFDRHEPAILAAQVPLTIRGRAFDGTMPDLVRRLQVHPAVRSIYVDASADQQIGPGPGRLVSIPIGFDPACYAPVAEKDRRLVFCACPTMDAATAIVGLAARCPGFRFVLCLGAADIPPAEHERLSAMHERCGEVVVLSDSSGEDVGTLTRQAAIYLCAAPASAEMPIDAIEAMATGACALVPPCAAGGFPVGLTERHFTSWERAADLIRWTAAWDDRRWGEETRRSVDHAFARYAPEVSARLLLDDWLALTRSGYLEPKAANRLLAVEAQETLFFGIGGQGVETLRTGFQQGEFWGVWAGQAHSSLAFSTTGSGWPGVGAIVIDAQAFGVAVPSWPVRVSLNGRPLGSVELARTPAPYRLDLGEVTLGPDRVIVLEFESPPPATPRDRGSDDVRRLGFGLARLSFVPA